jgi:hypothetical protein
MNFTWDLVRRKAHSSEKRKRTEPLVYKGVAFLRGGKFNFGMGRSGFKSMPNQSWPLVIGIVGRSLLLSIFPANGASMPLKLAELSGYLRV